MAIPAIGFAIHLMRERIQRRATKAYPRTVGRYQCHWNGAPIAGLEGFMVERGGPGDNTRAIGDKQDRRIREGTYRLALHVGTKYRSVGYAGSASHTAKPKPGLLLLDTGERTAVLIHPGMNWLWSVGCLNPSGDLPNGSARIDYRDSRARTIDIIEAIRSRVGAAFPSRAGKPIPGAMIVIDGEP